MDNSTTKFNTLTQENHQPAPISVLHDPRYHLSFPVTNHRTEANQLPFIKIELSPIKNMLPSLSTEVSPYVHHDYTMTAFLSKPQPPILPPISTITTLLSVDVTFQALTFPVSPSLLPITHPMKPWNREDDVNDVALALEQLRSVSHSGGSSIPEMGPTFYSNNSDVSPPNKSEDSLDSKKRPLAVTPLIIAITEISSSFIKTKPKKKRRKAEQIDRKFPCDYPGCPKSYGSEGALKTHKRLKHPDLPSDQIPPQPQSTALQQVHAVQIHPSQLLHHNANGGSIVQLLPSPQVLHQQTSNTVA
mmetsp:Transcript_23828/g.33389  ORF Transcript_23828/g.33389 Transcript_23828/m.33389 type:complete len:303 (+) Transcript_23828:196-1104(+)